MKIQNDLSTASYRKSTYSNGGDNCVETAADPSVAGIQDTKDRAKGTITVGHTAFTAFVAGAAAGTLR